jgi:NADP-dependent 3-hydroxy acid dehydrogenase YdfG
MVAELGSELDGQVAIITGASSGIGEATAKSLADRGASVVIAARRKTELEELAAEIEDDGGEVVVVPTDITDDAEIDILVETTLGEYDRIDILLNIAGYMPLTPIEKADRETIRRTIDVNLTGLMTLTQAVIPTMLEQESGHIVNVSSVAGRVSLEDGAHYSAAKFGVNGFSEGIRKELGDEGIRVATIEPGAVDTELTDHIADEDSKDASENYMDSITTLTPEDLARTITFVVTQPQHVDINELLITPTEQFSS